MSVAISRRTERIGSTALACGWILSALGLCAALIVVAYPSAWSVGAELWLAVIGATLVGIGSVRLCLTRVGRLGPVRWARIGPMFGGYTTVAFGLFSLGWLVPQQGIAGIIEPAMIPVGVAWFTFGLGSWTLGYMIGGPRVLARGLSDVVAWIFPGRSWTFRYPSAPVAVYLVGAAARFYLLRTGNYGYLQGPSTVPGGFGHVMGLIANFASIGLVMAAIDAFAVSQSFRSKAVLAGLLAVEVANGLFVGSKQSVVLSIFSVGLVYVFSTGRVPRRAAAGIVLAVVLVFPLVSTYRTSIQGQGSVSSSPVGAAKELVHTLGDSSAYLSPNVVLVESPAAIARRLREIDNVALILQKSPGSIPYKPWTDLVVDPAIDWVPRFVWPGKPVLSTGGFFSHTYYDLPTSMPTASAVTIPGDLLRHGGAVPLIVGMFMLGVLMAMFDVAVDPAIDVRRLVLFIPLLVSCVKSESGTTVLLVGIVDLFVAVAVVSRLAFACSAS